MAQRIRRYADLVGDENVQAGRMREIQEFKLSQEEVRADQMIKQPVDYIHDPSFEDPARQ
nr:MAG: hypothetical protein H3Bulk424501_000002 [Mitovirus sp.]